MVKHDFPLPSSSSSVFVKTWLGLVESQGFPGTTFPHCSSSSYSLSYVLDGYPKTLVFSVAVWGFSPRKLYWTCSFWASLCAHECFIKTVQGEQVAAVPRFSNLPKLVSPHVVFVTWTLKLFNFRILGPIAWYSPPAIQVFYKEIQDRFSWFVVSSRPSGISICLIKV